MGVGQGTTARRTTSTGGGAGRGESHVAVAGSRELSPTGTGGTSPTGRRRVGSGGRRRRRSFGLGRARGGGSGRSSPFAGRDGGPRKYDGSAAGTAAAAGLTRVTAELDARPDEPRTTRRARRQARREQRRMAHQRKRQRQRERGVVVPLRSPWRVEGALALKIADFGLSQTIGPNERLVKRAGSWAYMPCEAVQGQRKGYTCKFDVFSFGVCLYVACAAAHPFDPDGNLPVEEIKRRARHAEWGFQDPSWPYRSAELKDFLRRLITKDPRDRMTSAQALMHPWVLGTKLGAPAIVRPALRLNPTHSRSQADERGNTDSSADSTISSTQRSSAGVTSAATSTTGAGTDSVVPYVIPGPSNASRQQPSY